LIVKGVEGSIVKGKGGSIVKVKGGSIIKGIRRSTIKGVGGLLRLGYIGASTPRPLYPVKGRL